MPLAPKTILPFRPCSTLSSNISIFGHVDPHWRKSRKIVLERPSNSILIGRGEKCGKTSSESPHRTGTTQDDKGECHTFPVQFILAFPSINICTPLSREIYRFLHHHPSPIAAEKQTLPPCSVLPSQDLSQRLASQYILFIVFRVVYFIWYYKSPKRKISENFFFSKYMKKNYLPHSIL